jgi:hypothetical protein
MIMNTNKCILMSSHFLHKIWNGTEIVMNYKLIRHFGNLFSRTRKTAVGCWIYRTGNAPQPNSSGTFALFFLFVQQTARLTDKLYSAGDFDDGMRMKLGQETRRENGLR